MTYFNHFNRIFGDNSTSNAKRKRQYFRSLCIEELESRELLSVTLGDFDAIREQYADLNLSANMADYNIIEVGGADPINTTDSFAFSDAGIRAAIARAGQTTGNDLIVVRTTEMQNKIALVGTELSISINATTRGSITIVSLGTAKLTIDANQQSRIFNINNSSVALAGLIITNGKENFAGGGIYIYSVTLTPSPLTVTNCTIAGNSSTGGGGGIYGSTYTSSLTITNCTITENTAGNGKVDGKAVITGLASQKYTFGIREIAYTGTTESDKGAVFATSAIATFSVQPVKYAAPKNNGSTGSLLQWRANDAVAKPADTESVTYTKSYEVGIYSGKVVMFPGDANWEAVFGGTPYTSIGIGNDGTTFTTDDLSIVLTGVSTRVSFAVREVIMKTEGGATTVVAKSAITKISVKG